MNKWPYKVKALQQHQILQAIQDPDWQSFRLSLKGVPTPQKLDRLEDYLRFDNLPPHHDPDPIRQIRVDNYINALRRGGQLNHNNEVIR